MVYKIKSKDGISYLTIGRLSQLGLKHCFTTSDMDMGTKTNKSRENLIENFNRLYDFLDIEAKESYWGVQTHSKNVQIVGNELLGKKDYFGRSIEDMDGLITDQQGIGLITRYADCIPIILFDPVKKVHANIHSGWKGTLKQIVIKGLEIMQSHYGSQAKDIIGVLGPSIGWDDFEVDEDLALVFKEKFDFHNQLIKRKNEEKFLIDLQEINRRLMLSQGLSQENIISVDLSTYSTPFLHSYRRDGKDFGLMAALTIL